MKYVFPGSVYDEDGQEKETTRQKEPNRITKNNIVDKLTPKHYSGVIMRAMASEITGVSIVSRFFQAQIKENIKAPRHWSLWPVDPLTKAE